MTTLARSVTRNDHGMEGMVAKWYAANTGRMLDEFSKLARRVAAELPEGGTVLEVAPGPGYFCVELAKLGRYSITGLDLSHSFVEMARANAAAAGVPAEFRQGNAASLPFAADSFDFLVCRAAFKNFAQPVLALQEMHRVLKPGGRGLLIDLRHEATPDEVSRSVGAMGLECVQPGADPDDLPEDAVPAGMHRREQVEQMLAQTRFCESRGSRRWDWIRGPYDQVGGLYPERSLLSRTSPRSPPASPPRSAPGSSAASCPCPPPSPAPPRRNRDAA